MRITICQKRIRKKSSVKSRTMFPNDLKTPNWSKIVLSRGKRLHKSHLRQHLRKLKILPALLRMVVPTPRPGKSVPGGFTLLSDRLQQCCVFLRDQFQAVEFSPFKIFPLTRTFKYLLLTIIHSHLSNLPFGSSE